MKKSQQRFKDGVPRSVRVAEEIRSTLSKIFLKGDIPVEGLFGKSISVTKVILSKDLKSAKIYVMPLGGKNQDEVLEGLSENKKHLRYLIGENMALKYVPEISFFLDDTFDEVDRITELLNTPKVKKDWAS